MTTPELILLTVVGLANSFLILLILWKTPKRKPSIYREARYIINHADKVLYR